MLVTALAAILVFGLLIFIHELGHFLVAKKSGITVLEFAVGMGPVIFKKERNGTIYSLRLLPIGGFTSMEEDEEAADTPGSFSSKKPLVRTAVLLAGSVANILLGYVILIILTAMSGYVGTTVIADFRPESISQEALRVGDKITKINGHRVGTSNDITYEFLRDLDGLIDLTIVRDSKTQTIPVQFNMEEIAEGVNAISIDFRVAAIPAKPTDYLTYPINWGLSIIKQVWGSLIDLITGRFEVNQLSGPVGIVSAIGQASKLGLDSLLLMAAFIAINLGVFNLLPLPILDGGRIFIIAIEAIIRRPLNAKFINALTTGSVALILMLVVYATYNDIFRLIKG